MTPAEQNATDRIKELLDKLYQETGLQVRSMSVDWLRLDAMGGERRRSIQSIDVEYQKAY
jgi:hypothetical protein